MGEPNAPSMKGPIAWMARNKVAANLLMLVIVVGGLLGVSRTKQEAHTYRVKSMT